MKQRVLVVVLVALAALLLIASRLGWFESAAPLGAAQRAAATAESQAASIEAPADAPSDERALVAAAPGANAASTAAQPASANAFGSLRIDIVWAEDQTPAAAVNVEIEIGEFGGAGGRTLQATSDAQGSIRLAQLEPGPCAADLDRSADAGSSARGAIVAGEETRLALSVPKGIDIDGLVVDRDQEPVAGASIWLSSPRRGFDGNIVARSDAQGRFHVRAVRAASLIGARARDFAPSELMMLREVLTPNAQRAELTLVLAEAGALLHGKVLDAHGLPVAGATVRSGPNVRVRIEDLSSLPMITRTTADGKLRIAPMPPALVTDAAGEFEDPCVSLGELPLFVRAKGWATWLGSAQIRAHERNEITIRLAEQVTLEGLVRDGAGQAVQGVRITALGDSMFSVSGTSSDASGSYRLEGLGPGELRLQADPPWKSTAGKASTVLDALPGAHLRWDVRLLSTAAIAGVAIDESGAPLVRWRVSASHESAWGPTKQVMTAADGRFSIAGLEDARYTIELQRADEQYGGLPWAWARGVRPGGEDVVLRAQLGARFTCRVDGTLLDARGKPIVDTRVHANHWEARRNIEAITRDSGLFEFGPLPAGKYSFSVLVRGYPWKDLGDHELAPGEELHLGQLTLEDPGTLHVDVAADDGRALSGLAGLLVNERENEFALDADDAGTLVSGPLTAGAYTLLVSANGHAAARVQTSIAAGREQRLDVRLASGVERKFTIVTSVEAAAFAWVKVDDERGQRVAQRTFENLEHDPSIEFSLVLGVGEFDVGGAVGGKALAATHVSIPTLVASSAPIELRPVKD